MTGHRVGLVAVLVAGSALACMQEEIPLGKLPGKGPALDTAQGALSLGADHSCGVRTDGTLWCWGANGAGQLGLGDQADRSLAAQVGTSSDWSAVAAGGNHTCGIRQPGTLWCFGDNDYGQLGDGTRARRTLPTRIGSVSDWARIATGNYHSCAIRADGTLWCWGDSMEQVGRDSDWTAVVAGWRYSCGLRGAGDLYCFAVHADDGPAAAGTRLRTGPLVTRGGGRLRLLAGGWGHVCAVRADGAGAGTTACWDIEAGAADDQILRSGAPQVSQGSDWIALAAGWAHTCGVRAGGSLWCWGSNGSGMLGNGSTDDSTGPAPVAMLADWQWPSAGRAHSCARSSGGMLWCWGENRSGQLGDGSTRSKASPSPVPWEAPAVR